MVVFNSLGVHLMVFSQILSFSINSFMEDLYVVALALVMMIMRGSTFQPMFVKFLIGSWYFLFLM